tara:strand:- start:10 stop:384 length:375 start_codon:yes stop_codon:yes gene_type:complete
MGLHTARIIVGLFVTRNQKGIREIAKFKGMNPSEMLKQAYLKMGNHKPITAYKTHGGDVIPIGVAAPKKPKHGWINYGTKTDPIWEKTTDPQTGYLDKYWEKLMTMHVNAFDRRKGPNVEIVLD